MATSYAPAEPPMITDFNDKTLGPTVTVATNPDGTYPSYNVAGYFADAGEIADCLNQLVKRIQALETFAGIAIV